MVRLAGKVALITGAGSGIGLAAAHLFAAEGARLALVDLEAGALEEAAAKLGVVGGETVPIAADGGRTAW